MPVWSCVKVSDLSVFSSPRKLPRLSRAVECLCAHECLSLQRQQLEASVHLCSRAEEQSTAWCSSPEIRIFLAGGTLYPWKRLGSSSPLKHKQRDDTAMQDEENMHSFCTGCSLCLKNPPPSLLIAGSILLFRLQLKYCSS